MHKYLTRIVKLLEELTAEIKKLNEFNKAQSQGNTYYTDKYEADMDTKPRGSKGFNNDSLRGK